MMWSESYNFSCLTTQKNGRDINPCMQQKGVLLVVDLIRLNENNANNSRLIINNPKKA